MNASESVRARVLCMTNYKGRSQCVDQGLRTWKINQGANRYYTSPNSPESVSVQHCSAVMNSNNHRLMVSAPADTSIGFGGNMNFPIAPIPGAACSACDSYNTFYLPPLAVPGIQVVYQSNNYVQPCSHLPNFQGTAAQVGALPTCSTCTSCCRPFEFGQLNQSGLA